MTDIANRVWQKNVRDQYDAKQRELRAAVVAIQNAQARIRRLRVRKKVIKADIERLRDLLIERGDTDA